MQLASLAHSEARVMEIESAMIPYRSLSRPKGGDATFVWGGRHTRRKSAQVSAYEGLPPLRRRMSPVIRYGGWPSSPVRTDRLAARWKRQTAWNPGQS